MNGRPAQRDGEYNGDALDTSDLERINRDPVSFLAAIAIRDGASHHLSHFLAEELLLEHGTTRRIEMGDAQTMCSAMRTWAATQT